MKIKNSSHLFHGCDLIGYDDYRIGKLPHSVHEFGLLFQSTFKCSTNHHWDTPPHLVFHPASYGNSLFIGKLQYKQGRHW